MEKKVKITIVGIGGVGGYLSGMLAKNYENVTLVARGERKKSLEKEGIRLHSQYHGEITARAKKVVESGQEIREVQDFIFLCVKNYSLEEVCRDLQSCIDEHTVILPVMNGADTAERTEKFFEKGIVGEAVIYITAFFNPDYSITQIGNYAKIYVGKTNAKTQEAEGVKRACDCLKEAGVDCRYVLDSQAAVWEKYIFNCAYNVLTAYYMEMTDTLQTSPEKCKEFKTLLEEACAVALAKQISIRDGYVESEYKRFMSLDAGSTSSLKRDMEAGRKNELETFSGYLIKEARRLQIPVPVSEKMYENLKAE